ncbi:MAG: AAA family ATPase [Planctomycetota bacterium]|nr:AAA family ATPase [Planctomycetota bacterium]
MVKLKRLKIHKFRNVVPGVELHFDDRVNILVGKNATGKTTLLNVVANCLRTGLPTPLDEECHVDYDLEVDSLTITADVHCQQQEQPAGQLAQDTQGMATTPLGKATYALAWNLTLSSGKHRLRVRQDTTKGPNLHITEDDGPEKKLPAIPTDASGLWPALGRLIGLVSQSHRHLVIVGVAGWLAKCNGAFRFDESLEFYTAVMGDGPPQFPLPFLSVCPAEPGKPGGGSFTLNMLPFEILVTGLAAFGKKEPEKEVCIKTSSGPGFLREATRLLGFEDAELRMSLVERKRNGKGEEWIYGRLRMWFVRQDGSGINNSLLSYGQKRLLAFYYYLAVNQNVVVADELVNGFHHAWISECLSALGERQAFLTSQNPLLLDYVPLESAKQAERRFVVCRLVEHDGQQRMKWENISPEEAAQLYEAYGVGIQQVGEILRTSGLW